ncbi:hypothetical protein IKQ02_02450 [bacterium]|nr:hypothetical protein [bacterium]
MKKIKSFISKLRSKATIKTYQRPLAITLITMLVINFMLVFIAAGVALTLDDGGAQFGGSYFKALGEAFKWMLTPNSINNLQGADLKIIVLAVVVIAIGMVLFSGAIIATLTAAIKSYIDNKSQARGALDIEDHFVILNWNSKVPDMIHNLFEKEFEHNIIILSEQSRDYIKSEISSVLSSFGKTKRKLNLIIKDGNPLLRGNLEDISIEKAQAIVVVGREDLEYGENANISNSDLNVLKIALALGDFKIPKTCNIVCETDSELTKEKIQNLSTTIETLKDKSLIPVSFNKKIGQIIAQTVINPEMASIYLELLSYSGFEFYSYDEETVEEYLERYNNAIPIIKYNKLFVLAEDDELISVKRDTPYKTTRTLKLTNVNPTVDTTIFVIGNNRKTQFVLDNLHRASLGYDAKLRIKYYNQNDNDTLIEDIKKTEGDKKVLILSDDSVSQESFDSNVFITLIALQTTFPERKNISFITELLDSRNLNSVKDFKIKNSIISNRMMSLLIVQLALNADSRRFFDGLLTTDTEEGGNEFDIQIDNANEMLDMSQDLHFDRKADLIQSFYYSYDKKYMLMGILRDGKINFIANNQDTESIDILDTDRLIFIKY